MSWSHEFTRSWVLSINFTVFYVRVRFTVLAGSAHTRALPGEIYRYAKKMRGVRCGAAFWLASGVDLAERSTAGSLLWSNGIFGKKWGFIREK